MAFEPLVIDTTKWKHEEAFLASKSPYIALYGGVNNGKTYVLCLRGLIQSLQYPGSNGGLCRATYPELEDTTRKLFFKLLNADEFNVGDHPYIDHWDRNKNFLKFKNGSEIRFRHLGDDRAIQAFLSSQYDWVGIDQAEEVDESAFNHLSHRIGRVVTKIPQWIGLVGNPAGHDWVWARFKKDADEDGISGGGLFHIIEAGTDSNPILGDNYIERLRQTLPEREFKRFVLGSWDAHYGRVYDEYDEKIHLVEPFAVPEDWKMGLGMDLGWNHPTSATWQAVDYDGNWYVYNEYRQSERVPSEHSANMRKIGIQDIDGKYFPIYAPHDAINTNPITGINYQQAYADCGLLLSPGNRIDPVVGITRIKEMMRIRTDMKHPFTGKLGSPKWFLFKSCEQFREELGLYRWKILATADEGRKAQPDEVVKVKDDLCDAHRYWAMGWAARLSPQRQREKSVYELDIEALLGDLNKQETDWRSL